MHHSRLSSKNIPGQTASCLDCPSNSVSHLLSFSPLFAVLVFAFVFLWRYGRFCAVLGLASVFGLHVFFDWWGCFVLVLPILSETSIGKHMLKKYWLA